MTLEYFKKDVSDLDESVKQFYSHDSEAGGYFLDVKGAVSKERLDEFRNNNIELNKQMDELRTKANRFDQIGGEDLERLKKMKESGQKPYNDEDINAKVNEAVTKEREKFQDTEKKLSAYQEILKDSVLENNILKQATEFGVSKHAFEDVKNRAKGKFTLDFEKQQVVPASSDDKDLTIKDWMGQLQESAPHLFNTSEGSAAQGSKKTTQTKDYSKMDKAELWTEALNFDKKG